MRLLSSWITIQWHGLTCTCELLPFWLPPNAPPVPGAIVATVPLSPAAAPVAGVGENEVVGLPAGDFWADVGTNSKNDVGCSSYGSHRRNSFQYTEVGVESICRSTSSTNSRIGRVLPARRQGLTARKSVSIHY